jgi:hypothetical protein
LLDVTQFKEMIIRPEAILVIGMILFRWSKKMSRLIPEDFVPIRQAADDIAVAMFSGVADRPIITTHRQSGFDVADGQAIDEAISTIWRAVDHGKVQAFLIGPKFPSPLKLPADMSRGIPLLRSPRGGEFNYLRPREPHYRRLVEWFGCDLSRVSVAFKTAEIAKLARTLLKARRRKSAWRRKSASGEPKAAGRPSRRTEVKPIIREIVEEGRWSPTQSIKSLAYAVNGRCTWINDVSDDTVERGLAEIYRETGDRRFERIRRKRAAAE